MLFTISTGRFCQICNNTGHSSWVMMFMKVAFPLYPVYCRNFQRLFIMWNDDRMQKVILTQLGGGTKKMGISMTCIRFFTTDRRIGSYDYRNAFGPLKAATMIIKPNDKPNRANMAVEPASPVSGGVLSSKTRSSSVDTRTPS